MNLTGNHGVPWSSMFPAMHELEALEAVRGELVRQQKIRDLPILVSEPPPAFMSPEPSLPSSSRISHERECEAYSGDVGIPKHIGECYWIYVTPGIYPWSAASFKDLLAITVAASELAPFSQIDVRNPAAFRSARWAQMRQFGQLMLHFDPIWSPDGSRLLYTVWEPGRTRLEVLRALDSSVVKLELLDAYSSSRPMWSGDGRFVAYASWRAVKVFDTQTQTTKTLRPPASSEGSSEAQSMALFKGTRLLFGFYDGQTSWEYRTYDAVHGTLQGISSDTAMQEWKDSAQESEWMPVSLRPVRSPTGQYVATFTFVNGLRRVAIKSLR